MEAVGSSVVDLAFYQITRRHVHEDRKVHNHRLETLKCYVPDGLQEESAKQVASPLASDEIRTKMRMQKL